MLLCSLRREKIDGVDFYCEAEDQCKAEDHCNGNEVSAVS